MSLPYFIARRIYRHEDEQQNVSRPAIIIATIGIAIGIAVMILTVCVVLGFKHTIRDKVVGFGSHIRIENFRNQQSLAPAGICISDTLREQLASLPGVKRVELFSNVSGILKTDDDFLGVLFKGIGQDFDLSFLRSNLVSGTIQPFSSTKSNYRLVISKAMADKLCLAVGDTVFAYFISADNVRARRFTVGAIYQTNMAQFDNSLCFTDLMTPVRLNKWETDQCSGAEITVNDYEELEQVAAEVVKLVNRSTDRYGETLTSQTVYDAYPQVFSWLSLLDINVWVILVLMVCVAGFTMVSGLLIIILERTQFIGILKALGMQTATVRRTFLWFATFIIIRGMAAGNIIGIGIVLLQQHTGFVKLDASSYYVDTAPMELNIPILLLMNGATLLVSVLVLIVPSMLVSRIHPARAMRYE